MKIAELAAYIQEAVDLVVYANNFPVKAEDNCGFVRIEGGGEPNIYVPIKTSGFQIMIRNKSDESGEAIANAVWRLFHSKEHYVIGSEYIYVSMCNQSEPIYIGDDKNGRALFSINVSCRNRNRSN